MLFFSSDDLLIGVFGDGIITIHQGRPFFILPVIRELQKDGAEYVQIRLNCPIGLISWDSFEPIEPIKLI
jgi:hypothetical protein